MKTAHLAISLSAAFLSLLAMLHFLKPELDPSWRMISEYQIGRYGWLMSLAFFCWSGSVFSLLLSLRSHLSVALQLWFSLISLALIGAGVFVTNPILEQARNFSHRMHQLCGAIVILTFPLLATFAARALGEHPPWARRRSSLRALTLLAWLGMTAFFSSILISRALHPGAERVGPQILLGWPNRAMVVAYQLWLIWVAWWASRAGAAPAPRAAETTRTGSLREPSTLPGVHRGP